MGTAAWFCDPQAPWQKGTVENTNKRVRRYLLPETSCWISQIRSSAPYATGSTKRRANACGFGYRRRCSASIYWLLNRTA
jgi:hypothetical protein